MKLIVGLGNPGIKYLRTRHNVGFRILDCMTTEFKLLKKYESLISKHNDYILVKPQTFMNESGRAVVKLINYYKIKPNDVYIVYDDKDLIFGNIRIRKTGSAGGHNGIKSIIQYLGTKDFTRFRIGVKHPEKIIKDTSKYVLSNFSKSEEKILNEIIQTTINAIEFTISEGVDKAMNNFN